MSKHNPSHYDFGKAQVLDITQHLPFCEGNVVKYCARAGRKDGESKLDDLLKAQVYLETAISNAIDERARSEAEANAQIESCRDAGRPLKACGGCKAKPECPFWSEAPEGSVTSCDDCATPNTCKARGRCFRADEGVSEPVPDCITRANTCRRPSE